MGMSEKHNIEKADVVADALRIFLRDIPAGDRVRWIAMITANAVGQLGDCPACQVTAASDLLNDFYAGAEECARREVH